LTPFASGSTSSPRRCDSRSSRIFSGIRRGLPTLKELDYVNPSRSQTTIRQHLQRLVEAGIVEKVELPEDRRQNDLPYTIYGISEEVRRFLEEHKLLRAQGTLRVIYDRVEKTAEIGRYESAPRPAR
jgi:DNA-binding HxlR family transcriptional regulator